MEFSGITVSHQVSLSEKLSVYELPAISKWQTALSNFESSSVPTSCYQSIVTKDCVLSVTSTLSFFERIELGHGLVIQIFLSTTKRLCTRLAIPSQSGLH
jgi:hypothetical protein